MAVGRFRRSPSPSRQSPLDQPEAAQADTPDPTLCRRKISGEPGAQGAGHVMHVYARSAVLAAAAAKTAPILFSYQATLSWSNSCMMTSLGVAVGGQE